MNFHELTPPLHSIVPHRVAELRWCDNSRSTLLVSANRLLKFQFPPERNLLAVKQAVYQGLDSPKPPLRWMDEWPIPYLEFAHQALWLHGLGQAHITPEDTWLHMLWLQEDMAQYQEKPWLDASIRQMAEHGQGLALHQGAFSEDSLMHTIAEEPKTLDWYHALEALPFIERFLAARALGTVLPWAGLLQSLSPEERSNYPRLDRFYQIYDHLKHQPHWLAWQTAPLPEGRPLAAAWPFCQQWLLSGGSLAFNTARAIRPVQRVVLVEGATEACLIPAFANCLGQPLPAHGIHLVEAGGKNQMQALYQLHRQQLAASIVVLLDHDARDIAEDLQRIRRPQDRIIVLAGGEFEDLYDENLILGALQFHAPMEPPLSSESLTHCLHQALGPNDCLPQPRVGQLALLWRALNLGTFDKTQFAQSMAGWLTEQTAQGKQPVTLPKNIQALLGQLMDFGAKQDSPSSE
ncbi:MAG: ATP-dependent endonuclease [Candidatus Melainabacteria bacterium]|nr:ATP-dependent endonuclease [Candidatus Melainabacteria bacterium]